jgi:hypothetical protein
LERKRGKKGRGFTERERERERKEEEEEGKRAAKWGKLLSAKLPQTGLVRPLSGTLTDSQDLALKLPISLLPFLNKKPPLFFSWSVVYIP